MNRFLSSTLFGALSLGLALAAVAQNRNVLTPEEAAAGYVLLFNGTDLNGWRTWNTTTPSTSWAVAPDTSATGSNVLRVNSMPAQDLITSDMSYQDFDIKLEYRLISAGNSGLFIRYAKHNVEPWGASSGPEAQIVSNNHSDGNGTKNRNGAAYEMFTTDARAAGWDRPGRVTTADNFTQWQQFRVVAFNRRIAHFGNGTKLLEYEMLSPAWETAFTASKYSKDARSQTGYRGIQPGSFYLQHHGNDGVGIQFRAIRVKKLTSSPWAAGSVYLTTPTDSNSGLKDLAFTDNLFPATVSVNGVNGEQAVRSLDARVQRGVDGLSLSLTRVGDYAVTVSDLRGKTELSTTARNVDRITLPGAASRETRVLLVQDLRDGRSFRQLLAP